MKKTFKILMIVLTFMFLVPVATKTYAEIVNIAEGFNQVVDKGGSNKSVTDDVEVSKTIAETELENYFDITLSVKTSTKIEEIIKAQDLEVVLIMDISNTMVQYNIDGTKHDTYPTRTTRLAAAKEAVNDFITKFYEYSKSTVGTDVIRKIGFVTFNTSSQEVFGLSECKTEAQKNEMIAFVNTIQTATGTERFTNMESGLARAKDMLDPKDETKEKVQNQYIIFLTDGLPTTYSTTVGGYTGYNPNTTGTPTVAKPGVFYNFEFNKKITDGTNYSDLGARRAEELAKTIRDTDKVKIYSVGVGITNQYTLYHLLYNQNSKFAYTVDTDTEANNHAYYKDRYYAILPGVNVPSKTVNTDASVKALYNNTQYYKNWIGNYIGSGYTNYYFDSDNKTDLDNAYKKIFEGIKQMTEQSALGTWVAEDPMNVDDSAENIQFVGLYDDSNLLSNLKDSINSSNNGESDTAKFANGKINWDLKTSEVDNTEIICGEGATLTGTKCIKDGKEVLPAKTYYTYQVKYRVRLQNEQENFVKYVDGSSTNKIYQTNGKTTLTYVVRNNGVLSENKYLDFPVPSVIGYLGDLTFTKKSSFDNTNLSGARFILIHNENCECHSQRKYPVLGETNHESGYSEVVGDVISDQNGTVSFTDIPSGHTYKLIELEAPSDYIGLENPIDITISYGEVTGAPDTNIITNDIKLTNLIIKKQVKGNIEDSGKFTFKLELTLNGNKLTGDYKYKLNDGSLKTITFNEGIATFSIAHNDTFTIYDLPVGTNYKLIETTTEGYDVQYKINNNELKVGKTATCNQNCRLEEITDNPNINIVKFINTTGYILPETGSSGALILTIIGFLLFVIPVINMGRVFYKREEK